MGYSKAVISSSFKEVKLIITSDFILQNKVKLQDVRDSN